MDIVGARTTGVRPPCVFGHGSTTFHCSVAFRVNSAFDRHIQISDGDDDATLQLLHDHGTGEPAR